MAEKTAAEQKISERDERVAIALDPEVALRALLKVDPEAEPAKPSKAKSKARKGG
jgi:hypothetical protein